MNRKNGIAGLGGPGCREWNQEIAIEVKAPNPRNQGSILPESKNQRRKRRSEFRIKVLAVNI